MDWNIKGEAGKPLDGSMRLVAGLKLGSVILKLASVETDSLEWTAGTTDMKGTGTIVPALGQEVEIWNGEQRFFRGHVTGVRVQPYQVSVTAQGPWWWANKIPLSSPRLDSEGTEATRPSYVFPTQSVQTSIVSLVEKMIENGVPIALGTIDPMFTWPIITLSERSCAQALADLMSIVPDAVAWFDYSAAILPVLNVTRRGNMVPHTFEIGARGGPEDIDLYPRLEMQVASVDIHGMTRNAITGRPQWVTQSAGDATPGKNQIVVVSGPEAADFLPKDKYDSVPIQTAALPAGTLLADVQVTDPATTGLISTGALRTYILSKCAATVALTKKYGGNFSGSLGVASGGRWEVGLAAHHTGKPELISDESLTGKHLVVSPGRISEWLTTDNGISIIECNLQTFVVAFLFHLNTMPGEPVWWDDAIESASWIKMGSVGTGYGRVAIWDTSFAVRAISQSYPALTTVYRKWDYDYAFPPAGLADALVSAQNWMPWEGSISVLNREPQPNQYRAQKINVSNCLPECETMGALVKSVTHNLKSLRTTIHLGTPARLDFGTLQARFRGRPKDNIQML